MENHSWTNQKRSHHNNYHNTFFNNSTFTSESSSEMKHYYSRISMDWSSKEQSILEDGLIRYASEPSVSRYAKIASELENKSVRDVAMRCKWTYNHESNKRRKEDYNGGYVVRDRVNNKEIIDMVVASNSASHKFVPPLFLREEDRINNELLHQNNQFFKQISSNLTSSKLIENMILFYKSRENIEKLLHNMNENVPEPIKHMPPLPIGFNNKLLESILLLSNLQNPTQ
ncbi:unnamed protein product [Cochlearia groenlandica]